MPSSQAAATERRNDRLVTHEPPKLKTTLKTPPKQATNPLQFVKVGPCSLYRTAQEQLQKVQEVKKIKQEVRDDPEDWQSNLDNWKSSRRKRQEHIIERVVEVKKLELEEHDRQRRRSKTFSEMMEERGRCGRKLSMSLAMYHEEDANDLSDLGIGTSSGKSSVSGDTHDDMQSVLSDRDSEIEKNHSDLESVANENGNSNENNNLPESNETASTETSSRTILPPTVPKKPSVLGNGFHNENDSRGYDPVTAATLSSPEPEEYTYEGAIRGYVSRVAQNIPRRSLANIDAKLDNTNDNEESNKEEKPNSVPIVKVDVLKRREIFEKASQNKADNKTNNNNCARSSSDLPNTKSIKERLSSLEKQKSDTENTDKDTKAIKRLSSDMSSIRERFSHLEIQTSERESKVLNREGNSSEVESTRRLSINKFTNINSDASGSSKIGNIGLTSQFPQNGNENAASTVKERLVRLEPTGKIKEPVANKKTPMDKQLMRFINEENSTPSERSSSPDSEYRAPRAAFHRSLDSLDADGSSGPDTFERVQSLEELDYSNRYPPSSSSAELLHDTDREDSGIHTADVSCSVSQADEPVDEEIVHQPETVSERKDIIVEKAESQNVNDTNVQQKTDESKSVEVAGLYLAIIAVDSPKQAVPAAAVTTKESIIGDIPEQESECQDEPSRSVEYEEVRNDGPAMELVSFEDSPSETSMSIKEPQKKQQLINEIQQLPESTRPVMLPVQTSPYTDNTFTYGKTDIFGTLLSSTKQIPQMNVTNDAAFITALNFPLGPSTNVEPPKEKPPPPPTDLSDEENMPVEPLKRLNSTRRIKKELRTRRSDFLGIEGINDDDLEREVTLTKPPDMAAILAAERRIEQLDRRSYDTDSNYEQDSSHERDSGVELGHTEDWSKQPVSPDMSQHSRQSSEPFGASVTSSEEDEITKKEREIIEVLEKEEQWRYGNDREQNSDIGEKLAHKLRELEEEKMQLERDRAQETELRRHEETLRKNDENERKQEEETLRKQQQQQQEIVRQKREAERVAETAKREEEKKLREDELLRIKTEQLRMQEDPEEKERRSLAGRRPENMQIRTRGHSVEEVAMNTKHDDDFSSGEVLRVERELLQLEQEELKRRRTNMAYREQRQLQLAEQLQEQWQSLQNVANVTNSGNVSSHYKYLSTPVNHRSSMPNLQLHEGHKRRPPPPPIPPSKPSRLVEQMQRDVTIRNSRIPSADSIPQQVENGLGRSGSSTTLSNHAGQQMTKETLHALSAVPRPRIVKGDQWVQRRKSDVPRGTQEYNYQHWLIQEAEQRRITEKNQRSVGRKPQQHVTGTSVPYSTSASSRPDGKPLPDSIIQTLTQRVQNRVQDRPSPPRRRLEQSTSHEHLSSIQQSPQHVAMLQHPKVHQYSGGNNADTQEKMLSVSGKKKCSHCGDELGRGAAMIIESLRLFYHMECFKCCVCHVRLGDGLMGTDVRVRNHKLHCHNCYSSDDGVKFSCV